MAPLLLMKQTRHAEIMMVILLTLKSIQFKRLLVKSELVSLVSLLVKNTKER